MSAHAWSRPARASRTASPKRASIIDIARRAGLTKQAIGLLVKDMAAAGLAEVAPDPDDARARLVRIPKAKWTRHEEVGEIVTGLFAELERRIGASGMTTLIELLRARCDAPPATR